MDTDDQVPDQDNEDLEDELRTRMTSDQGVVSIETTQSEDESSSDELESEVQVVHHEPPAEPKKPAQQIG